MKSDTRCLFAGSGPAGMMCGYLLARAGIEVMLEKHSAFQRDFRGDTIHPSTLTVLDEVALLDDFLERLHQRVPYAEADIGDSRVRIADSTHLPAKCPYIVFMLQWEFLNFLSDAAQRFPHFSLLMETEVVDLVRDSAARGAWWMPPSRWPQ